jgi:hypothetical protein
MEETYFSPLQRATSKRAGLLAFLSLFLLTVSVQVNAQRVTEALVSLYTFHEGSGNTVHDVSGFQSAEDLIIDDVSKVSWLASGGLSIDGNTHGFLQIPNNCNVHGSLGNLVNF